MVPGKGRGGPFFVGHEGASMAPFLSERDLLEIDADAAGSVGPGDVVAFVEPGSTTLVIHRVIELRQGGLLTIGDANARRDPWLVPRDAVVGRVAAVWRGSRRRRILGGRRGRLAAAAARLTRTARRALSPVLRPPYLVLLALTRRLGRTRWLRPRVVVFRARGQEFPQLLLGRRVVGSWDSRDGCWRMGPIARLALGDPGPPRLPGGDKGMARQA